jgi:hypothetical protein
MGLGVAVGVYEVTLLVIAAEVEDELEAPVGMYMVVELTAYVDVTV